MQIFCCKCKLKTDTTDIVTVKTKNGRLMLKGTCSICGSKKCSFTQDKVLTASLLTSPKKEGGKLDLHALIGKLPKPKGGWTLPGHKYTGPWNPLEKQLDENDQPLPGQEPYNQVDAIAMRHDICYRDFETNKHDCDRKMISELNDMKPNGLREKVDRAFVKGVIGTKLKLGLGAESFAAKNSKKGSVKFRLHPFNN